MKKVLLNIDLADVGTFFVFLWPLMALTASFNSLLMFNWHTAQKIGRTRFQRFAANVEHSEYHAVLSLLVRRTGGKHRGLQAWNVTPKTVRMCFGVLLLSPREPADVSAGASRCLRASQPMQYSTRLPLLYEGKLFTNFPELFTKISGTIH